MLGEETSRKLTLIYLDMDGVLADFDRAIADRGINRVKGSYYIHTPEKDWSAEDRSLDEQVKEVMKSDSFWSSIPLMPGAKDLWDFCSDYEVCVLTARPRASEFADVVAKEKYQWVWDNLGPIDTSHFICCLSSEKQNFIGHIPHPHQILVDDLKQNCDNWTKEGGIAIHFQSADSAIQQLKDIISNAE